MLSATLIAGRYCIPDFQAGLLGRGGMGNVYRGLDTLASQPVAIKVLKPELVQHSPDIVARFQREGEALRQLNHPNIVRHIDAVQDNGQYYLIMEYVPGGTLADVLLGLEVQQRRMPISKILHIALELADALARAHHLGIIHRDLKPANVLLAEDGTPRLADFGVAHLSHSATALQPTLTQTGLVIGTIDYLSPEACQGEKLDGRADIWSFGVMLYEMLTGEMPFQGDSVVSKLMAITLQPPPDLYKHCPDASDALVDLVYRMLEKDRQQRIPSMRLVGAELESILQSYDATGPDEGAGRAAQAGQGRFTPPLSAHPSRRKHNLPTQPTPFIGREAELADLESLLADPQTRLVTILGLGGMGKTRLAIEAAARCVEHKANGVFFVSLSPLQSPEAILPALASAFQLNFDRRFEPLRQLLDYLAEKELLLVLDNFEHLLSDTSLVSEILQAAPGVQILATSRLRLNIAGEHIFHLEGMDVTEDLQAAYQSSAVKLFLQGARRAQPGFELQAGDLRYVLDICRLVHGMPLGILLAAAWVEMLTLQEIAAEAGCSNTSSAGLDLLESSQGDLPERQRSIRVVFDYSWERLSANEQQVFQSLSVFRGGFTRQAAQEVADATLQTLMALVNKSLLHRTPAGRYELHELLRQYATEKLANATSAGASIRDRHAAFYSAYSARWLAGIQGPGQRQHWAEMELEHKNLQVAWNWAVERQRPDWLAQAADGVGWFYWFTSRVVDGAAEMHLAIQRLDGAAGDIERQAQDQQGFWAQQLLLARLLTWLGLFNTWRDEHDPQALPQTLFEHSLALCDELERRNLDVRLLQGLTLFGLGYLLNNADRPAARRCFERSADLLRQAGHRWELALILGQYSHIVHDLGDLETARQLAEESLEISRALGDRHHTGYALDRLGHLCWVSGRLEEGETLLRQALEVAQESNEGDAGEALYRLGEATGRLGKFAEAAEMIEQGIALLRALGQHQVAASEAILLAEVYVHLGRYAQARQECASTPNWQWSQGFGRFVVGLAALGEAAKRGATDASHGALAQPLVDEALAALQDSIETFHRLEHRENLGWASAAQAYAWRLAGQPERARQRLAAAFRTTIETKAVFASLYALPAAALLLADQGRLERSAELYSLAWRYGFVSRSRWFSAAAESPLIGMLAQLPGEALAAARQRGREMALPHDLAAVISDFS